VSLSRTFWRYTAFQLPGWIIAGLGGWWAHHAMDVPIWLASSILLLWVIKDYVLYPFLRSAYELDQRLPIEHLIGQIGLATAQLTPDGYIKVRGELWLAKIENDGEIVNRGDPVKVSGVNGSTLVVQSCNSSHSDV
jgi:membrane protein implicated in regulation of membrane protease activity